MPVHGATVNDSDDIPFLVPEFWVRRGKTDDGDYSDTYQNIIAYHLTPLQRIFVMLEYPNSSKLSKFYSTLHTFVIILCVLVSFLSSVDSYQTQPGSCFAPACDNDVSLCPGKVICPPEPIYALRAIDFGCFIFYSVDLFLRVILSPFLPSRVLGIVSYHWDREEMDKDAIERREEPNFLWWEKTLRYLVTYNNMIDLLATLPYFVLILVNGGWAEERTGSTIFVLTAVRLARCVRLLKLMDIHPEGSPRLNIILKSLHNSVPSLSLLFGILLVSAVVFGSVIYSCEHGFYKVTQEYPDGEYYRTNLMGETEVTPFRNLGSAMYWAIVTMTTLGYGDLFPSTPLGRVVGSFCVIYGIVMISLPITVVNNAFTAELDLYKAALKVAKKVRKETARRLKQRIKEKYKKCLKDGIPVDVESLRAEVALAEREGDLPPVVRQSRVVSTALFAFPVEMSLEKVHGGEGEAEADYEEVEQAAESEFMSKSARLKGDFGGGVGDHTEAMEKLKQHKLINSNDSAGKKEASLTSMLMENRDQKPKTNEKEQEKGEEGKAKGSPRVHPELPPGNTVKLSNGASLKLHSGDGGPGVVSLAHREADRIFAMQRELHTIKAALLQLEEAFDEIISTQEG